MENHCRVRSTLARMIEITALSDLLCMAWEAAKVREHLSVEEGHPFQDRSVTGSGLEIANPHCLVQAQGVDSLLLALTKESGLLVLGGDCGIRSASASRRSRQAREEKIGTRVRK